MRVAVYVPCFNGAAWIEECVGALLEQSWPVTAVAVVDDGSTDASADIVRRFGRRVRLIQHERNRGLAVARNTALREIECDVLASVDADVRAAPTWLAHLMAGFNSPRASAVGGKLIEAHQERIADRWRAAHMAQHAGDFPLRNPPILPGANVAVRRDVVRALGGYDESFRTNYEDADLQHRLIERGYHCHYVPDAVAHHLRTDSARTVLRTYWGWLRPPAERAGAFDSPAGLATRRRELTDLARRAMWQDVADGAPELSYLSLLVALAFPLADASHGRSSVVSGAWRSALRGHPSALARAAVRDLDELAWWPGDGGPETVTEALVHPLTQMPTAWISLLHASRERLAAEERWEPCPPTELGQLASGRDPLAVIEHGPTGARRRLIVTRTNVPSVSNDTIAAHRIGWLRPSVFQQSLLCTGVTVSGDPAALAAVPSWRPHQIDPRDALDELEYAERELIAGRPTVAAQHAVAALLLARRHYTAFTGEQSAALTSAWPEMSAAEQTPPAKLVSLARALVDDWLFEWEHKAGSSNVAYRMAWLRTSARQAQAT